MDKTKLKLTMLLSFIVTMVSAQTAMDFDGSNDYIDCGNDPSIQITGKSITLEAWTYPTSFKNDVWAGVIINKAGGGGDNGYMIRMGNSGQVNFNIGSGSWNEINSAQGAVSLNTWHHIAGTLSADTMRLYVDGTEVAKGFMNGNIGSSTNNLWLGDDSGWNGRYFPGKIDEARVWNIARSEAEINNDMNNEFCTMPAGLVAYYKFYEGIDSGNNSSKTVVNHVSGNSNNGTLYGFTKTGNSSNWVTGKNTVKPTPLTGNATLNECGVYKSPSGKVYTTSNTYQDSVFTSSGCDSIVTLNLTILQNSTKTDLISECESYTWRDGKVYTSNNTTATHTVKGVTSNGCDSVYTLDLTILKPKFGTDVQNGCGTFTWIDGNDYTTNNNTAKHVIVGGAANNCDSTVTLNLTMTDIYTILFHNKDEISSLNISTTATYQWLDCNNNKSPITGKTNKLFTATENGSYAVEITDGNCKDTSDCQAITSIITDGINDSFESNVQIFPNPNNGQFVIDLGETFRATTVEIKDLEGRIVSLREFSNEKIIKINLESQSGIYLVVIKSDNKYAHFKLIKN